jgi:hypothetical protein
MTTASSFTSCSPFCSTRWWWGGKFSALLHSDPDVSTGDKIAGFDYVRCVTQHDIALTSSADIFPASYRLCLQKI